MPLLGLFLAAAISVATPPDQGRYMLLDEDEEALGVLDGNTVTREGSRARVLMAAIFAEPTVENGEPLFVIQIIEEADCATGKLRHVDFAAFSRDLQLKDHIGGPPQDWQVAEAGSRAERIVAYLCRGYVLDDAGTDFRSIAQAYWDRRTGNIRT